jgi:hypothetical protein
MFHGVSLLHPEILLRLLPLCRRLLTACSVCDLFIAVVLICVLVPAFGVVHPVRVPP